ncbi:MAG: hypothetical protein QM780_06560 [Hyphomicrobium sp.]|uniref:hypothetical protein n=1 Tax=Hyphomicrobium sp. TaxID=82 RepID=UPI0039E52DD7
MSHHKQPPQTMRILIACSPAYRNRRAIMEALGSIFIDTIELNREYYYFECPAMDEIFDDGAFNREIFHALAPDAHANLDDVWELKFTYVVVGGDDEFAAKFLSELGGGDASLVRLA